MEKGKETTGRGATRPKERKTSPHVNQVLIKKKEKKIHCQLKK